MSRVRMAFRIDDCHQAAFVRFLSNGREPAMGAGRFAGLWGRHLAEVCRCHEDLRSRRGLRGSAAAASADNAAIGVRENGQERKGEKSAERQERGARDSARSCAGAAGLREQDNQAVRRQRRRPMKWRSFSLRVGTVAGSQLAVRLRSGAFEASRELHIGPRCGPRQAPIPPERVDS